MARTARNKLAAGFQQTVITPPLGIYMHGYGVSGNESCSEHIRMKREGIS